MSPQKTALFLFGVFFVAVMLIVAIAIPQPTEAQWRVFNLVLALVAAAIGAILPGMLHVQFTPWLRAGGALALFVLVYLVKPTTLVANDPFRPLPPPPPIESAKPVIDGWLSLLDKGDFKTAYGRTYPGFRERYAEADFIRLGSTLRSPLGDVVERREVGQNSSDAHFTDRGHMRVHMFLTRFRGASEPIEEYVSIFAKDAGGWYPAGYHFNVQKAEASRIPLDGSDDSAPDVERPAVAQHPSSPD